MKRIIVSIGLLVFSFTFSQEAEIKAVSKSAESENWAEVKQNVEKASALVEANKSKIDPELLADYYYAKGMAEIKDNNISAASQSFSELSVYDSQITYSIKNKDTKEKLFFTDKSEAEKTMSSGNFSSIKESSASNRYSDKVRGILSSKYSEIVNKALADSNAKNFESSGINFETAFNISKSLNMKDEKLNYYAALMYFNAGKYTNSNPIFESLINSKYTGVTDEYELLEKATGKKSIVNKQDADLYGKMADQYTVTKKQTESLEKEIYQNASNSFEKSNQVDKSIELVKKYLSSHSTDKEMNELLANLYIRSGKTDEYLKFAENLIASDPTNDVNYFNMGVLLSKIPGKEDEAVKSYDKAISLNPKNFAAYLNAAIALMAKERPIMEQLKNVGKDQAKETKLRNERKDVIGKAIPYLEKALETVKEGDDSKALISKTLKDCYKIVGNTAKANELK